jgi:hypothetical protein
MPNPGRGDFGFVGIVDSRLAAFLFLARLATGLPPTDLLVQHRDIARSAPWAARRPDQRHSDHWAGLLAAAWFGPAALCVARHRYASLLSLGGRQSCARLPVLTILPDETRLKSLSLLTSARDASISAISTSDARSDRPAVGQDPEMGRTPPSRAGSERRTTGHCCNLYFQRKSQIFEEDAASATG